MKNKEFRPAPFWFLNHKLEEKELTWQLEKMKEQGIGGAVLHSRHGLNTPYLSEEWFKALETCIKKAKELGMVLWLYDEENWPSGPAGGRITENFPEFRMRYLYLEKRVKIKRGKEVKLELSPSVKVVLSLPVDKGKVIDFPQSVIDLTSRIKERVIKYRVPSVYQEYELFVFSLSDISETPFYNNHYLDLLNPEAVKKFIKITHKEYEKRFKKYFGKTILGIFTDEPAAFYGTKPSKEITYTPSLFEEFKKKNGYDMKKCLPALFLDIGAKEERERIRIDYYETLSSLYQKSFYKEIYDFCERNGLYSIGHMLFEGEVPQVKYQLDFFKMTRYMHYSGLDFLTKNSGLNSGGNLVGPKFASSAGHLLDKKVIMSETSGEIGWNYDLSTLKRLIDWQLILGVNYFIPHAFFYSMQGFRKGECPPDEFWRVPLYNYYKKLSDYIAQTTKIFTGGKHLSQIGILYPNRSIWAKLNPGFGKEVEDIWDTFTNLSRNLLSFHYEYDYMSEELIQKGKIEKGRLKIGDEEFQLIILPGCSHLKEEAIKKLKDFASKGGKIILLKCSGKVKESLSKAAKVLEELRERDIEISPKLRIKPKKEGKEIVSYSYAKEGDIFYLLFNDGKAKEVKISLPEGNLYLLQLEEEKGLNKLSNYKLETKEEGEFQIVTLNFAPDETKLLMISSKEIEAKRFLEPKDNPVTLKFHKEWEFKLLDKNVLPLKDWQQTFNFVELSYGGMRNSHQYSTSFGVRDIPEKAFFILDGLKGEKVWGDAEKEVHIILNGEELKGFGKSDFLDHYLLKKEVKLKKGKNSLIIQAPEQLYEAVSLCDPLYIIGDFSVINNVIVSRKPNIKTGDWAEQGYPYYSGRGAYIQELDVPSFRRAFLSFPSLKNGVRILINRREAGVVVWNPYQIEVTEYLKEGKNLFRFEVANTLYNLIAGRPLTSGLLKSPLLILEK